MSRLKNCARCGKPFTDYWPELETLCPSCRSDAYDEEMERMLSSGEKTSTDCEHDVYCPWCGVKIEGDCEDREFYEEGSWSYICPECEKEFLVSTYVSYSYSTDRELPAYMLRERGSKS